MKKNINYNKYLAKDRAGIGRPRSEDYEGVTTILKPVRESVIVGDMPIRGIPQTSLRSKFWMILFSSIVLILLVELIALEVIEGVTKFYEYNYFARHSIVRKEDGYKSFAVVFSWPMTIEKRENPGEILVPVEKVAKEEEKELTRTEVEVEELIGNSRNPEVARKVIDTFGVVYGPKALAVFTAESGLNCLAIGINTNRTVDLGVAQINSIHFNDEFTAKDALDCNKAIEWSEQKAKNDAIASGSGEKYNFNAWVAYTTNRYMAYYK